MLSCIIDIFINLTETVVNYSISGKGKVHPRTGNEGPEGEYMYSYTLSLTSVLEGGGGGWSTPSAGPFTPGKRDGTHHIGSWMGPRAGLDWCGKSRPPPAFDSRTVQPVASRYTD